MPDVRTSRSCCGLEPTPAVEDTLRIAFVLDGLGEPATTTLLSHQLGVRPSTVSSMIKRLEGHGLVDRTDSQGVVLTEHGARHARDVVRRHRLLETFFVEVLGMAPEGTRARGPYALQKGKTGPAYIAARADVQIVPVGLTGTEKVKRNLPRLRRTDVRIVIGKPFRLPESGRVRGEKLREYTDLIMYSIAELLPEEYRGVYA